MSFGKKRAWRGGGKHKNRWVVVDGIKFQSQKEADRYAALRHLERLGEITELELQVRYDVMIDGKLIFFYKCDFRYTDKKVGEVVEDVKGVITDIYVLKKKFIEAIYGIKIIEV